jgi:RNA polymerase sigma-70 factor (ECF subfamily)
VIGLASQASAPDEQAELHIEADYLREALTTLTEDQQQVLVLKFISGMTTEEIARQLGKRAGAVRALQMRALQALSKTMEEEEKTYDKF